MRDGDLTALDELTMRYQERPTSTTSLAEKFQEMYRRYAARREEAIIDAAAVAAALEVSDLREHTDPRIVEAFHLQYPNVDIHDLSHYNTEQLQGFVNGLKGKFFEVIIKDKLNCGQWVGDLHLSAGEHASLAHSAAQPGWDLQIADHHGHVVDLLQAKATDSLAPIHEALVRYPDIHVITTLPGADHLIDGVIDAHVNDAAIQTASQYTIEELSHTSAQEFLHHINPLIPALVITATEGYRVIVGRSTLEQAAQRGLGRLGKSMSAMTVAALLHICHAPGLLCIGGSIATRIGIEAFLNQGRMAELVAAYSNTMDQAMVVSPQPN